MAKLVTKPTSPTKPKPTTTPKVEAKPAITTTPKVDEKSGIIANPKVKNNEKNITKVELDSKIKEGLSLPNHKVVTDGKKTIS
ncbi:hypothetical protein [Enterococcus innesii]|uniref:hypothetical protein n=1 Tax=Enterococcus innesii TaxID=2839759 RepID=UPI0034A1C014